MSLARTTDLAEARMRVRRRRFFTQTDLVGYLFISPWFVGFLVFTLFPFVASLIISLTNWQIVGDWEFVGTANYQKMLSGNDRLFVESLKVTFTYSLTRVPLTPWPRASTICPLSETRGSPSHDAVPAQGSHPADASSAAPARSAIAPVPARPLQPFRPRVAITPSPSGNAAAPSSAAPPAPRPPSPRARRASSRIPAPRSRGRRIHRA